ncbi:NADPH-dependent FMN reductase [Pseudarthrobacter sulfonivorans]|uniref:NADPH-dependent FMN reductase n=1 Tax=Pseudarthrobacter sulfonivorans TaxID=121292 RepID=UPI0027E34788|nr:NAD(P)H-dependent oxidoreductase [Pseudarthrobacter sulfonivorans]
MSWFKIFSRKSKPGHSAASAAPVVSTAPAKAPVAVVPEAALSADPLKGSGLPRIAIITGASRPGSVNKSVAEWVLAQVAGRSDADVELVDIADFNLPLLDEAYPAAYQNYQNAATKAWSAKISEFDGFIFVVHEYNHTAGPVLTNAMSYLNAEFNDKVAGFVSYGSAGGARAVEHLREILSELQVAHVRNQVMFSLFNDFENFSEFKPTEQNAGTLAPMVDQLVSWAKGFATIR